MFCQACGAKNTDNARFCNMCGARIAPAGAPGGMIAGPTAQGVASLELPIGSVRDARPRDKSEPTIPDAPVRTSISAPSISAPAISSPAISSPSLSQPPQPVSQAPAPSASTPSGPRAKEPSEPREMPAVLSRAEGGGTMAMGSKDEARADAGAPAKHAAENVWDHHDEARSAKSLSGSGSIPQPTGYLPSSASQSMASVSLAAIGVQSRNRTWAILVGGALLFLVLGALGMYAIMKTGQGETAHASEGLAQNDRGTTPEPEIDIGTPLPEGAEPPDTDFIAGGVRPSETGEERPTMSTVSMTSMAETSMTSMEGSISTMSTEMTSTMSTEMQTEVATMETTTMESTMTETPDMTDTVPEETDERDLEFELYVGRVRYAIRRYYAPRAQSCFEHATRNDPNVRGTVVVRFSINADGSVTNSSVLRNTTGNEALGRCLANQALTWRLPQTYNGETIPLEIPFAR